MDKEEAIRADAPSPIVQKLMNRYQPKQRTPEWFKFRENMITASEWGSITGDNPYSSLKEVLIRKCSPSTFIKNDAMTWGTKYEQIGCNFYISLKKTSIIEFGCLQHLEHSFLGASPDGITPDGIMLEIKCPPRRPIDGHIPPYYLAQIQGQLEVCDLDICDYLECKIVEYSNEKEYLADTSEQNRGSVITFTDKDNNLSYKYSAFAINAEQMELWEQEMFDEAEKNPMLSFYEQTYWKLEKYSCVRVERDRAWFADTLQKLTAFWKQVEYYRLVGIDKYTEAITKNAELAVEKKTKKKTILNKHIGNIIELYNTSHNIGAGGVLSSDNFAQLFVEKMVEDSDDSQHAVPSTCMFNV